MIISLEPRAVVMMIMTEGSMSLNFGMVVRMLAKLAQSRLRIRSFLDGVTSLRQRLTKDKPRHLLVINHQDRRFH